MSAFVWLLLAIAVEVAATTALKFSEGFTRLVPSLVVVLGYGSAFYFLSRALQAQMPVGTAYALWSGIGTAAISIIGALFLGETLTTGRVLGILLIIAGVVVLNMASGGGTAQ